MRRLPVIQPAFERRAFLLGLVSAAAACSAEPATQPRRQGGGGTGQPSADGGVDDGGRSTSDAGPRADGGPGIDASTGTDGGGRDAGADTGGPGCAIAGVDVGPPASFAMGTLTYIAAVPAFIGRDANGLYAMHAFCTHTIGNLSVNGGQLVCSVHGARFSLNGDVLQGPATAPLPHFEACLNSKGNVAVDSRIVVPANTRLNA